MASLLSFDNPVFSSFALHGTIVVSKMLAGGLMTSYYRVTKKVFANPEDLNLGDKGLQVITDDPDVERSRRIHQNDLENIVPFVLVGGLYVLIKPEPSTALILFRTFTTARILHTICYTVPLPQPSRVLCHTVALCVTGTMAVKVICKAWGSI